MARGGPRPNAGGKREGAGRKPGTIGKRTKALAEIRDKALQSGITPLEVMLKNMRRADAMADAAERATISFAREALSKLDGEELLTALIAEGKKVLGLRGFAQDCARDAAVYMHSRLATTTIKGDGDHPLKALVEIAFVSPG
jgi:hypothetical protein